jgi:hypothetical protein
MEVAVNLMPGEKVLIQSDNGKLVLTSHRVRFEARVSGRAKFTSIMLEGLVSCQITYTSAPILLWLALLSLPVGAYFNTARDNTSVIVGLIAAALFVLGYFVTRTRVLSLASAGGATIDVGTKGMSMDTAKQFIDKAESAKNERYLIPRGSYSEQRGA